MNFKNILQDIEKNDPEVYEKLSGRRHVLKSFGAKVAVAALPLALASLFKKAYGKTTVSVLESLNFALELEYFEYTFYRTATNTGGLIPAAHLAGFQKIEAHEKAHIAFLQTTITALSGVPFIPNHYSSPTTNAPYVPAAYDFTKGGTYADVFSNYVTFLMMAQVFEDTGIKAYNGQLPVFHGGPLFTQLQQLAAVESRHAAHSRLIRRQIGAPEVPASWITNDIAPKNPDFQPNYAGEANTKQLNIDISSLPGIGDTVPLLSATAAFDEPIDETAARLFFTDYILP